MGLHPLLSVFQTIDLHDVIQVTPSTIDQHVVEFDGLDVPADNTCTAVFDALADQLQSFWTVTIKKNIPSGAGLGGGSSNAATLLMALNDLESLNMGISQMADIAQGIGSDVPFFLYGGQAKVAGTGEEIIPNQSLIDCPYFVLILPNIHCSTGGVYGALDVSGTFDDLAKVMQDDLISIGHNRLQQPAFTVAPKLGALYRHLSNKLSDNVVMSGSGSTLFVPCESLDEQVRIFDTVNQLLPNFDGCVLCVGVS